MTDDRLAALRREVRPLSPELRALAVLRSGLLPLPTLRPDGSVEVPSLSGRAPSIVSAEGRCDCAAEYNTTVSCWHEHAAVYAKPAPSVEEEWPITGMKTSKSRIYAPEGIGA